MLPAAGEPATENGAIEMNTKQATGILTALIQGVDPQTGEELPAKGVLHNAKTLRALLVAVKALEEQVAREARRATLPANVGSPWTAEDERKLVVAFQSGEALSDIGEQLGRTLRGIESRLERLGLLTADQRVTQEPFASKP
jgi:hypothetical protein